MRNKRKNKATKRANLSYVKEALKDQRCWGCLGVVVDDGDGHWEFIDGDLIVDIEMQPSGELVSAVLGSAVGGNGAGIWSIPPLGSEVIVLIPDGQIDFQPTIVAVTNGEGQPDGLGDSTIVIQAPAGGEVIIHDGNDSSEPLMRKSDYDNLKLILDQHQHPTAVGPSGTPLVPMPSADGTSVLKGK